MRWPARQDAEILLHVGQDYHFSSVNPRKAAITSEVFLVCFTCHRFETALHEEEKLEIQKEITPKDRRRDEKFV